eukprot:UN21368
MFTFKLTFTFCKSPVIRFEKSNISASTGKKYCHTGTGISNEIVIQLVGFMIFFFIF